MGEQEVYITTKPTESRPAHGTDKALEDDDPYALTGVRYPVADGVDADREVALALVEEFALAGWPPHRIGQLFAAPQSGSMHDIYRRRGPQLVEELLKTVFGAHRVEVGADNG